MWVVEAGRDGKPDVPPRSMAAIATGGPPLPRDGSGELEVQSRRLDGGGKAGPGPAASKGGRVASASKAAGTEVPTAAPAAPLGLKAEDTATGAARPSPARAARPPALSKDAYRRQKAVVEGDLTRLGLRKSHLELALGDPATQANYIELRRVSSELADVDAALAQAEEAWLVLEDRAPR
jgi:hypothetical protein